MTFCFGLIFRMAVLGYQFVGPDPEQDGHHLGVGVSFVGRSHDEKRPRCPPGERQDWGEEGEELGVVVLAGA